LLACAFCHVIARGKQRNDIYFKHADRELDEIRAHAVSRGRSLSCDLLDDGSPARKWQINH
jgi:hypothetical protein